VELYLHPQSTPSWSCARLKKTQAQNYLFYPFCSVIIALHNLFSSLGITWLFNLRSVKCVVHVACMSEMKSGTSFLFGIPEV
jgi:hypothetical protein